MTVVRLIPVIVPSQFALSPAAEFGPDQPGGFVDGLEDLDALVACTQLGGELGKVHVEVVLVRHHHRNFGNLEIKQGLFRVRINQTARVLE